MPVKVYDGTNWVTVAGDGQAGAPGTSSSIATWVKTASGGETSVSGAGDTGYGTLAYTVGQELVYLNGVLLDRGDDYTATNGTSITGLTALTANDVVTVWTVNSFSVANTYTQAQSDARYPAKAGSVLQVVQGTLATAATTTSGTLVDTGLSVSITPTSATSKILVISSVMASKSDGPHSAYFTVLRDSTNLVVPTSPSNRSARFAQIPGDITGMQYYMSTLNWTWLDSPATTSALTYKVQYNINGGTGCINRTFWDSDQAGAARGVSTITVMEIGA